MGKSRQDRFSANNNLAAAYINNSYFRIKIKGKAQEMREGLRDQVAESQDTS